MSVAKFVRLVILEKAQVSVRAVVVFEAPVLADLAEVDLEE